MKFEEKTILSYTKNDLENENTILIKILNQLGYKVVKKYYSNDEIDYLKIKVYKALERSLENKQTQNKEEL